MKKNAIGILLALAFTGSAHAGTFSNDYVTVTYDDSFWAGANVSWNVKTGTLRFGDLVDQWGLVASANSLKDVYKSDYTQKDWSNMLTITANNGYVLSSVETGIRGSLKAEASIVDATRYAASGAWAETYWTSPDKANTPSSVAWANTGVNSEGSYGQNGQYSVSGLASFAGGSGEGPAAARMMAPLSPAAGNEGVATATLNWFGTGVSADTYGTGNSARATINQVYFTVQTAPVPEPETYAMFLAGLGLLGAVARRRSR